MAGESRTTQATLALYEELSRNPTAFGFYYAVRLLENLNPDKARLGEAVRPTQEPVRLAHEPALTFSNSTLARFDFSAGPETAVLSSSFLGLFGPQGPLPTHLTEYVFDRVHNEKDRTFARFADIFHHRALALFYRAWANAQPALQFDRADTDRFSDYVGALAGVSGDAFRNRDVFTHTAKLRFAGLFSRQRADAESLVTILRTFFRLPVTVEQFVGEWVEIPDEAKCRLGQSDDVCTLGRTATIGRRVWSAQHKIRAVFGPLSFQEFLRFLPGQESLRRLTAAIRLYCCDQFEWDLQLILRAVEIPDIRLGEQGRLGWTTWLAGPRSADADDAVIRPSLSGALSLHSRSE